MLKLKQIEREHVEVIGSDQFIIFSLEYEMPTYSSGLYWRALGPMESSLLEVVVSETSGVCMGINLIHCNSVRVERAEVIAPSAQIYQGVPCFEVNAWPAWQKHQISASMVSYQDYFLDTKNDFKIKIGSDQIAIWPAGGNGVKKYISSGRVRFGFDYDHRLCLIHVVKLTPPEMKRIEKKLKLA